MGNPRPRFYLLRPLGPPGDPGGMLLMTLEVSSWYLRFWRCGCNCLGPANGDASEWGWTGSKAEAFPCP
eukprot:1348607-Amorphochlora_amoeboformis.AAC.3